MPEQSTETEPLPSNEGDYLNLANELKSQFDEEKAKWKAKFDLLEYQNNSMKEFIKRINNVTSEIIKTDNKRMFDEIDNGTSGSSEPPRRRRRRVRRFLISRGNVPVISSERTGGPESFSEIEREALNAIVHNIEQQIIQNSVDEQSE